MLKVAIIEDEIPARQQLKSLLNKVTENTVIFEATSVKEAVHKFGLHPSLDLVFMDIQLNDGLSLDIFEQVQLSVPIIFTTAFDHYLLAAFQQNGIDYLLKPLKKLELESAILKYNRLKQHFVADFGALLIQFQNESRKRFLAKKGVHFVSVEKTDVAYFFSKHKVTFLVNVEGQKLIVDETLSDLELTHRENDFFRLNRQYLVSHQGIEKFISDGKGKLIVSLTPPTTDEVVVSQEKSGAFKKWLVSD